MHLRCLYLSRSIDSTLLNLGFTAGASSVYIQLDWQAIALLAYASTFAVAIWFQNKDQFWIFHQKLHDACFFIFRGIKKWARKNDFCVLGNFGKKWWFSDNQDTLAIKSNTSIKLICAYKFKGTFQKLFVGTIFCLYWVFRLLSTVRNYE